MGLLADLIEYSHMGARRNGRIDGEKNIPGKTQREHSPFEQQLAMRANKQIRTVAAGWENDDRSLKGDYVKALGAFHKSQQKAGKEVPEAESVLGSYRDAMKVFGEATDEPQLAKWKYYVILALIAFGEIPLTAKVFEILGDNKALTYVFALVLCVSVPVAAHFVGMIFKEKMDAKRWVILLVNGLGFGLVLFAISYFREKYFEAEAQQLLGVSMDPRMVTLVFLAIQLLIFIVAATASYFAHDSHPGRKKKWGEAQRLKDILAQETAEAKAAESELHVASKDLAEAEAKRLKTFEHYRHRVEEVINNYKMIIQAYRAANVRSRGDAEIESFKNYPDFSMPPSLQDLDMECGPTVPESVPVLCAICGESNPSNAARCKKCGNNLK